MHNKADFIYEKIKNKLEGQDGMIIAIDINSEDYFIGKNIIEAYEKGNKKHPHSKFFFKRIGSKTTFVVGYVK
tara:strand:+ start:212 stop:430 length:219 start_codon:yes stop_codon:yes gene_type:complete